MYFSMWMISKKVITLLCMLPFLLVCCREQAPVQGSFYTYALPLQHSQTGEFISFVDTVEMISAGNRTLYRFSIPREITYEIAPGKDSVVAWRYHAYFSHLQGQAYGYFSDSGNGVRALLVNADSFLATKGFVDDKMFQLKPEDSLVETRESNNGASLTRKYLTTKKQDVTYPDTSYYYFTTDPRISSLGNMEIEGRSGRMRLRKVSFVYRPVTIEGLSVPLRTLSFKHGVLDSIPEAALRKIFKQHYEEVPVKD